MSNLLFECENYFGSKNLYDVLCINKKSSEDEIKRAYRKASLQYHPDRVIQSEKEEATKKFQVLGKVYAILSDSEKKAVYDESGEIDEDSISQDRDWLSYWRLLFKKITIEDIKKFENTYRGSAEEKDDLKSAYLQYKGDMDRVLNSVLCSDVDDEDRFREIMAEMVEHNEVPKYKQFFSESKAKQTVRHKKAAKEAREAEQMKQEIGLNGQLSLNQIIAERQASREKQSNDFFKHLEAKYSGKVSKSKRNMSNDDEGQSSSQSKNNLNGKKTKLNTNATDTNGKKKSTKK